MNHKKKITLALICGMLGCLCFGGGDWLMIYGDPAYTGNLSWLTVGAAQIPQWRYSLAMGLAFPGILLYGTALFAIEAYITNEKSRKLYHYLNAFGLTPWLALHLFYIMILSLLSWMNSNGYREMALPICEGLFGNLSWVILVSEAMMLPVFIYWFVLQISGKTIFPKGMAFTNVLFIYGILKTIQILMPVSAGRLAFTNGLMSESMIIWFGIMLIYGMVKGKRKKEA